jgi:UDP-GlcNAc:undecaprenyl-phosphate GlcNAc-1-phosphate transferase
MSFIFEGPYFSGLLSFITSLLVMPIVIKFAHYKNWVVAPRNDRWHSKPTALMGGIGIFFSYCVAIFLTHHKDINLTILGAGALIFTIGLIDDLKEIKPIIKLIGQVACTFILLYNGYSFGGGLLGWAGIPLTFLWVMGITNAINLLDNMDGLSAGISAIVAFISGVLGILSGEIIIATMAFALTGSSLGFLIFNFKPAKIFMGDCGSLFLGFSLSFLSIAAQGKLGSSSAVLVLLVPISLMIIPIMDTSLVVFKRIIAGRRIDQGGKDHTSHRLVALGLTEKKAVLILYFISIIWGILCVLLYRIQINNLFLCLVTLTISSVVFSIFLSNVKVYNESEEKLSYLRIRGRDSGNNRFSLRLLLMHKKLIIGVSTDVLIIYTAFLVASRSLKIDIGEDYIILGLFILVKTATFYIANLYHRIWRYIAVAELAGYFSATIFAGLILYIYLLFQDLTSVYNHYFVMIDFLLTFTGLVFSRHLYRWLVELFNKNRESQKRVIIYGAGDGGYLLIKELLQNRRYELKPIGWIDDDFSKHHLFLYGFKILGSSEDLLKICHKLKPDMIVISTNEISVSQEDSIRRLLLAHQIEVGRFSINLSFI